MTPSSPFRFGFCCLATLFLLALAAPAPAAAQCIESVGTQDCEPPGDGTGSGSDDAPTVSISPPDGPFAVADVDVTITWCDDNSLDGTSREIWFETSEVTSEFTYEAITSSCGSDARRSEGSVKLSPGDNSFSAKICDNASQCTTETRTYTFEGRNVQVTPDGDYVALEDQTSATQAFVVENTGAESATYDLSATCSGTAHSCQNPTSTSLASGQLDTVEVSYQVGAAATTGEVRLRAEDTADGVTANEGWIDVDLYRVGVSPDGTLLEPSPNSTVARDFTVENTGSDGATYDLAASCSGTASGCAPDQSSVIVAAGTSDTVEVTFQVGDRGETGTVTLTATQSDRSAVTDDGWVDVEVPHSYSVSISPQAGTAEATALNADSEAFTVTNTGSDGANFDLTAPCTGDVSECAPSQAALTLASDASASIEVSYVAGAAGTTGDVRLAAVRDVDSLVADTGRVTVTAVEGVEKAPLVEAADLNPGTTLQRNLCLRVAMDGGAAAECGDLRLTHVLPATSTFNKGRAPALLYNSGHADPHPLITAEVALPDDTRVPDRVTATLSLDGSGTPVATEEWPGSLWEAGAARRIVIGFDGSGYGTGLHTYELEVTNWYDSDGVSKPAPVEAHELVIVDRSASPFGAGWWLGGLERLVSAPDGDWLWVAGDGSTRRYESVSDSVWAAERLTRPDTLKRVSGEYVRELPGGTRVRFDDMGRHVATENRLGHTTVFSYSGSDLTRITLPVPSGAPSAREYDFGYASSALDSVAAPPAGSEARVVHASSSAGRITALTGPDGHPVEFGYGDADHPDRITVRWDRRGTPTSIAYDEAGKLTETHLHMTGDTTDYHEDPVTTLRSPESQGLAPTAATPSGTYVRLDGPRPDSVAMDTTAFHLNGFGMPERIGNALGHETVLERADPNFSALVTKVTHPNSRVVTSDYDDRGRVIATTDSGTIEATGAAATTRYDWDDTWDKVTLVVPPEGDSTVIAYEPGTGHRDWQQDARGDSTRVYFRYYGGNGLVRAVETPDGAVDSVTYDGYGNVKATHSPTGIEVEHHKDDVGRDRLVVTPISDTSDVRKDSTVYDAAGRVERTVSVGPEMPYNCGTDVNCTGSWGKAVPAETLTVVHTYDANGNTTRVERSPTPDSTGTVVTEYTWDRANRKDLETNYGSMVSYRYDHAGNVTEKVTPRGDAIEMRYDALGQLTHRIVPEVFYPEYACGDSGDGGDGGDGMEQPMAITAESSTLEPIDICINLEDTVMDSLRIAADTATFTYDAMGNMLTAYNGDARVDRSYFPNGWLRTDTLRIREYTPGMPLEETDDGEDPVEPTSLSTESTSDEFDMHVYGLRYSYDRNGRRTELEYPDGLTPSSQSPEVATYAYHPWGALERVTGPMGDTYAYTYDAGGRRRSLTYPGDLTESYRYDLEGRLERRTLDPLYADTLEYDPRGKVTRAGLRGHEFEHRYSGLGQVVAAWWQRKNENDYQVDEFRADALGNRYWSEQRDALETKPTYYHTYNGKGQLEVKDMRKEEFEQSGTNVFRIYDVATNTIQATEDVLEADSLVQRLWSRNYYDADQTLRATQRYARGHDGMGPHDDLIQEFRYDALGRRVIAHARHEPSCSERCDSFITRSIWDGDRLLYELKAEGASGDYLQDEWDSGEQYGRVGYVHGPELDHPLGVMRENHPRGSFLVVPHADWKGNYEAGTRADGSDCTLETCGHIDWPAPKLRIFFDGHEEPQGDWMGSLIQGQRDESGRMYRRNRYYDPHAGQFTQTDPIGLAGGLNLYGYAGGDPVNYSDPFGLKADTLEVEEDMEEEVQEAPEDAAQNVLMLDSLSRSTEHWTIQSGAPGACGPNIIIGCAEPSSQKPGGTITIIAEDFNKVSFFVNSTVVLGHELGHAVYDRNPECIGEACAVNVEQAVRIQAGLPRRP